MANQKDKIRIEQDTKEKLEVKKALYGCTSYSKTVNVCIERLDAIEKMVDVCIERLDAIEKMVDDCNGDDSDNKILHESLYELFNGEKR